MSKPLPRYPIYVPSKGRHDACMTAEFLKNDGVPFRIVVEPQEADLYASVFGDDCLLVLPRDNGGLLYARNWIRDHATAAGHERHWQLDDNIKQMRRWYRGTRIPCDSAVALVVAEDFADRHENVAICGLNYTWLAVRANWAQPHEPFRVNVHVYSCTLFLNSLPYRWRSVYNDDTDICLQVLSGGWCTVNIDAFAAQKARTMTVKGGNTDALYQGDGRLRMARSLERLWPGVVTTKRRWQRPQHVIDWTKFTTPLRLKPGVEPLDPEKYAMKLVQQREPKSAFMRQLLAEQS